MKIKMTKKNIAKMYKIWFVIPAVIILAAMIVFAGFAIADRDINSGMNIGTDFAGGSIVTVVLGEDVIGKQTKVKVVKNKVAPPFRRAEFDIMFGEGISRAGEIIDLGTELGIIKKSGSWFSYNDTKLAQGRDAAKQVILDNPELAEELEGLIFEELKKEK